MNPGVIALLLAGGAGAYVLAKRQPAAAPPTPAGSPTGSALPGTQPINKYAQGLSDGAASAQSAAAAAATNQWDAITAAIKVGGSAIGDAIKQTQSYDGAGGDDYWYDDSYGYDWGY